MTKQYQHIFIDLSYFMVQRGHIFKELSYNGQPTGIYYGVIKLLQSVREIQPKACIHFIRDGNPIEKRKIYPAYKINRDEVSYKPSKDFNLIKNLQKMLTCYKGVFIWYEPEYEADDLIASLALRKPRESLIMSGDNDFLQLIPYGIDIAKSFKDKKFELHTQEYINTKYNVEAKKLLVFRALQGDKSDNIVGVVPTKQARKLIELGSKKEFEEALTDEERLAFYRNITIMSLTKFQKQPIHHKPLDITPDKNLYTVFGLEKLLPNEN